MSTEDVVIAGTNTDGAVTREVPSPATGTGTGGRFTADRPAAVRHRHGDEPTGASRPPSPTRLRPLACRECGEHFDPVASAICASCLGPLEPVYPPDRRLPSKEELAGRPANLWRYAEWLPFEGEPAFSRETGFTPLIESPRLAHVLGIARAWIKHDGVTFPSLSFKDRVVASAINAAHALCIDTLGCASTGNLANAVAAQAARAGFDAWIFIPEDLEIGKIVGTSIHGANLVRVRGTYDDVNRLCAQIADRFGWGIVNVNLRAYYGEGSKTMAWEIAEQLGWRMPDAVIAPMAGGSLVTRLDKGFKEVAAAGFAEGTTPHICGAQASGCSPIVNALERTASRIEPVIPNTIARSIAIGNPADGALAVHTIRTSGGWAAAVDDAAIVAGIRTLAETTGIFTETAGGATIAAARALVVAGRLRATDELVLCITGNGLKTVEAVQPVLSDAPIILPRLREVVALVNGATSAH